MAGLFLAQTSGGKTTAAKLQQHGGEGMLYANAAIELAALGQLADDTKYHLFALSIELAFKSLALRAGASPEDCKKAGHRISEMIKLIEKTGTLVSDDIKRQLNNDEWFKSMLDARYAKWGSGPFVHSNYPEIIAKILEIACDSSLTFEGGSALVEISTIKDRAKKKI